jgi:hypothetical protein
MAEVDICRSEHAGGFIEWTHFSNKFFIVVIICPRQNKSEPRDSTKNCHSGVSRIAKYWCASNRPATLFIGLLVAGMLWPVRPNACDAGVGSPPGLASVAK